MAIKKLTFSFEVPITQLLGLIATGNSGLKIDVVGDDRVKALPHAPKLLERPRRQRNINGTPAWHLILKALAADPKATKMTAELSAVLVEHGLNARSVSPQIAKLRVEGLLKRTGAGQYQITPKGVTKAAEIAHG